MKIYPTYPMKFSKKQLNDLAKIVDNGTVVVSISTPEGFKCDRCNADYYHTHSTYSALSMIQKGIIK